MLKFLLFAKDMSVLTFKVLGGSIILLIVIAIPFIILLLVTNCVIDALNSIPNNNKKNRFTTCAHRYIYKVFLDTIRERGLQPYILKMTYKQIISMLNVPELNIKNVIIDPCEGYIEDERALLLIYTYKHYVDGTLSGSFFCEDTRKKNGLILFVPKTYKDYCKLCHYFADLDTSQMDDNAAETQMESLKYLTNLIHQVQDKHKETLQDCQVEMDRETKRQRTMQAYFRNRSDSANEK